MSGKRVDIEIISDHRELRRLDRLKFYQTVFIIFFEGSKVFVTVVYNTLKLTKTTPSIKNCVAAWPVRDEGKTLEKIEPSLD